MSKVLILGKGGREHAIAYKLKHEGIDVFVYPGNPGILTESRQADIHENSVHAIADFCRKEHIDLVVIGPEQYLADGFADILEDNGIRVFGPGRAAARIETDKSYAKDLMERYNVNTAKAVITESREQFDAETKYRVFPYVIKVSGLAAGKGAFIIKCENDLILVREDLFTLNRFGDAAEKIIIEDFLIGEEISLFIFTDGKNAVPMLPAQDYKCALDNDLGGNTGGMGSFAPYNKLSSKDISNIMNNIVHPVLKGMRDDGNPFRGLLYAGLIKQGDNISVIEFNARFGDPETQSLLFIMESSLYDIMNQVAHHNLTINECRFENKYAVTVVIAASGYPDKYEKGMQINIGYIDDQSYIFHAGSRKAGTIISDGGRILAITSKDKTLDKAINRVYTNIKSIKIDKSFFRKDIAYRGLKK